MSKKLIFAALLFAGAAGAQAQNMPEDPYGDATVTRAEAEARIGERFAELDTDKDGTLTAAEFSAGRQGSGRRGGGLGGGGLAGGGMGRLDADGDGKLAKSEYVGSMLSRFDRLDANQDGQLTKAERDEARARMMERMREGGWGGGSEN